MDEWGLVAAVGRRQFGLVTLEQLRTVGLNDAAIRWAVSDGRLDRLRRRLYRLRGVPESWHQRALAALLLAGPTARLSHGTAAHLWRFDGFERPSATIDVTVPREHRVKPATLVCVHRAGLLSLPVRHGSFSITSRAQTLVDLAGVLDDEEALEIALDSAHRAWPFIGDELERFGEARDARSVPGLTRLLAVVRERGGVATESRLEVRMWRRIRRTQGLPQPELQHYAHDTAGVIMRVDFAWPRHRVAVHTDSFQWHAQRCAFDHDAGQRNRMTAAGWEELIVTEAMVRGSWLEELARLLRARDPQRELSFGG